MILLAFAVALAVIAWRITLRFWPHDSPAAPGPLERLTLAALIALALWLASTWALALLRWLTPLALAARTVFALVLALLAVTRRHRQHGSPPARSALLAIACAPMLLWCAFMLWRGAIVPPVSHDALSYHLPKAVLFQRFAGFRYLEEMEPRQRNIPANYELLLTEMLVTQGRDTYTEWPSAVAYVLFVIAAGALAERWWNRRGAAAVLVFAAGVPVVLLHAGAHKNDLMTAFCAVAALVAAGRYLRAADTPALLAVITAVAIGLGFKPQIAGLAFFLAPFVLLQAWRTMSIRTFVRVVVFGLSAFLMLGGVVYVVNVMHQGSPTGRYEGGSLIAYGDWRNLWEAPYVLIAAPFVGRSSALPVPWEATPWFWQKYEIYFSHLGMPLALSALAMPLAAMRLRREGGASERAAVSAAAAGAFLLMLPVVFKPHGMYAISLPRYALFIVPVVFAWTVGAWAARTRAAALALILAGFAFFGYYAVDNARNDAFVPWNYLSWARTHPGTRKIPFNNGRAASVVDRLAGPRDLIAFDAGYASWTYPAFGAELTRPVYFIPPGAGPALIPDAAKWVVVDRSWGIFWGAAENRSFSEVRKFLMRGQPTPDELRVRRQLLRDPRFRIAYLQRGTNQIVFERVR